MAKKKEMTLEEKLNDAIVKDSPYEVPENWVNVKLGVVAKWRSGGTPSRKHPEYYKGKIPWIKTGELNNGYIYSSEEKITDDAINKSSAKIFKKDSVVMAMYGATIGKVAILGLDSATNQACAVAECYKELINNKFLFYYLLNEKENFINLGKGGAQPNISQAIIKEYSISLPPLKEQQRIVDRIESLFQKLNRAKELIEEARESFEKRKAAILKAAFNGKFTKKLSFMLKIDDLDKNQLSSDFVNFNIPYNIPNRWQWIRFNECCIKLGSGSTPKGGSNVYQMKGIPFIRSQNVLKGKMNLEDIAYISEDVHEKMKGTKAYPGDTLLNITGASIGRSAMINENDIEEANVNQHVCIFRFKKYIFNRYPSYWFNSPVFQDIIFKQQIGVTRQALNFKQLRGMWMPVPPIEEQKEIVKILDKLLDDESKIEELTQVEDQIELIKKSILAKAFRGELGTNCKEDGNAVELLKEILSKN